MLIKAFSHELSHASDANAQSTFAGAAAAACAGDGPDGCKYNGSATTNGTAEALALQILEELGDPDSFSPDTGTDAEAGGIIYQGNAEENGGPPFLLMSNRQSRGTHPISGYCPAEYHSCN
jgi:hypothetical protein